MRRVAILMAAGMLFAAGCGSSEESGDPVEQVPEAAQADVKSAQEVDVAAFPKPVEGEGLDQLASQFDTGGPQAAMATSVFRVGENRLAFGVLDENVQFVYGDTVVYLASPKDGSITGPYAAPADVLITEERYRSKQAATETDPFAAVYTASLQLDAPGVWQALVVSDLGGGRRIAAGLDFEVVTPEADRIPDVGERAPKISTETVEDAAEIELIDTRQPPAEDLHQEDFADVIGKQPVALLFATPQLCQSRVCGPVVDEMLQLKDRYGDRMTFIHQEVFVDNVVEKGLRDPLEKFNLRTEPWLFTFDKSGRVAARLEGSFGLRDFEKALEAALQ